MALKLENGFFNMSDDNDMSFNDRIKNAFAVDGKVNYKDLVYNSEEELREFLVQEGILPKEYVTDVIRNAVSKLVGIIFVIGITALSFTSCNYIQNKENEKAVEIDKQVSKQWCYKEDRGVHLASLISQNYYVSNKGENIYGQLIIGKGGAYGIITAGISIVVIGSDKNTPKTVLSFPQTNNVSAIFDGGTTSCPAENLSNQTIKIKDGNGFYNIVKESHSCTIYYVTTDGEFEFTFDLTGFEL